MLDAHSIALNDTLVSAVLAAADAIVPVMFVEDGSGALRTTGTAFVLSAGDDRIIVTAEHVLEGPEPKFLAGQQGLRIAWPKGTLKLDPLRSDVPHADVAWGLRKPPHDFPSDLSTVLPVDSILPVVCPPGGSLVAVGFPGSKTKFKNAQQLLAAGLASTVGRAVSLDTYERLGLDPNVHLAMSYDRFETTDRVGNKRIGPLPHGMSGGVMCWPGNAGKNGEMVLGPFIQGILTHFYGEPHNVMVATRIEHLLACLGRPRSDHVERYRAVSLSGS